MDLQLKSGTLRAYCLDWHVSTSGAFVDMLVEPLKPWAKIELTAWDGSIMPEQNAREAAESGFPTIFCQFPPPETLLQTDTARLVWLPMWDHAKGYPQSWWDALPRRLRIVALSDAIANRARAAGLDYLHMKYFKNPTLYGPVEWDHGNVVFYWNRNGLVSPFFLKKFCRAVKARQFIFLDQIDPRIPQNAFFPLAGCIGGATVVNIQSTARERYLEAVKSANIFIAPRSSEGVGMTFLEAMARGCAVFAYAAPTMTEYIRTRGNGYLFNARSSGARISLIDRVSARHEGGFPLTACQDWPEVADLDYRSLGKHAREDHERGYQIWANSLREYADFILEW